MLMENIFYTVFLTLFFAIIFFKTDFLLYYSTLLGILTSKRVEFAEKKASENSAETFLIFLLNKGLDSNNRIVYFICSLTLCPMCFMFWGSVISCLIYSCFNILAICYCLSVFMFYFFEKTIRTSA
jgi:hypothetical protein